jgi:16S rRNA (cytosine967-C5)-methyltransferase
LRNKRPRAICLDILNRVEGAGRHPDRLLTDSFKRYRHFTSLDRAFLTELTYGALRWRGKLDWVISQFSKTPFEKIESEIVNILRIGLYQILFLTRTPVSAAVNESVELAKKTRGKGGGGFVNAILRSVLREKEEISYPDRVEDPALHISVVQSYPLWLVRRWATEFGLDETMEVCVANQQVAPLVLRTNTLKISRENLISKLIQRGLNPMATFYSDEGIVLMDPPPVSDLSFFNEGFYVIQDEASQLVTSILDPRPGEIVLDACAAPGGKTTHIAQRMKNEGKVYGLDLTVEKLKWIEEGCQRLGVTIVNRVRGDARRVLPIPEGIGFDRILADVPCSGFGTLRRNPDLKWRKGEEDVARLSSLQSLILDNLSTYLLPGGILVYSTCTVFHEENEDVVEQFLADHSEFRLDPIDKVLPERCHPFIKRGYFTTFPRGDGMDGFFVARLARKV